MPGDAEDLLTTRVSLLNRLKDWQDDCSWQEFFHLYWRTIYGLARKSGLTDAEAQDVVQATMLAVAKLMPGFKYNPALGSFKSMLLKMTHWRIIDQIRKRSPSEKCNPAVAEPEGQTPLIERIADPNGEELERIWEAEWQQQMLEAAMLHVKQKLEPVKYRLFDCYINKGWPPRRVAEKFGVGLRQVYAAKHHVQNLLRQEVSRLEKEVI